MRKEFLFEEILDFFNEMYVCWIILLLFTCYNNKYVHTNKYLIFGFINQSVIITGSESPNNEIIKKYVYFLYSSSAQNHPTLKLYFPFNHQPQWCKLWFFLLISHPFVNKYQFWSAQRLILREISFQTKAPFLLFHLIINCRF